METQRNAIKGIVGRMAGNAGIQKNKKYRLDAVNVIEVNIGGNVWKMRSRDIEKMIDDAVKKKYESRVFL